MGDGLYSYATIVRGGWGMAVVSFGVLDVLVTMIAVGFGLTEEANPLVAAGIDRYDLWILPVWKGLVLVIWYQVFRTVPRPYNAGVPIGLALLGFAIVCWNAVVLVLVIG